MEDLTFSKVQKGDIIYLLEKDRRSGYPIYDSAQVIKLGESKPMPNGKDGYTHNTELVIQDSVSQTSVYLPTNSNEGIFNGVYYTTNVGNIINELNIQKQSALNVINNIDKYQAIVSECDRILGTTHVKEPNDGKQELNQFKEDIYTRMNNSDQLLHRIAQELGIFNKPAEGGK